MKPKILIVDDKAENLLALERVLAGIGAQFVRAESGNQALASTLDHDFALALVDVQMPDMDGFETVELMRQQDKTRYLPVIFVSAIYNEQAHLIRGVETGAVDFIVKPIVPQILIGKVKVFLELYSQKRELELLALERGKKSKIFKDLAEGLICGVSDRDICNCIVSTCASIFNTENAMIGRIIEGEKIETCICLIEGRIRPSMIYDLKDSPCGNVVKHGLSLYSKGVQQTFSMDEILSDMAIEGYAGVCLKDSNGKPLGVLNVFSKKPLDLPDNAVEVLEIIAGRASAELERQRENETKKLLQERLHQAQKMEAIGTLAGGIAHDFNNVLMPILGFSEMARDSLSPKDPLRKNLGKIIDASNRAKDLVQQILTFSRQSGQEKRPFLIHLVVKEALKLLRATIPVTIEIRQDIDPDCGWINADPTRIHQIVMNLCTNSYHAMRKERGTISLTLKKARGEKSSRAIHSLGLEPGKYIKLEVSDTGRGMDKETCDRVFEPYFTTKSKGEGTGLGLSVVHGIIEHYKGGVRVSSEPGKGSVFEVFFPESSPESPVGIQNPLPSIPKGREHILFVDDEDMICEVMGLMLESLGYKVTSFNNPAEALKKVTEEPDLFNLVITDMTMPEMTGTLLAQEILKIIPDMPILLCTGFSELTDHEKVKGKGIKGYLTKPVSKTDLAETVRDLLNGPE